MDYLELQTRANLIVEKVNAYEAQLSKQTVDENEILSQHKYADLYSLRPVLKLLLGETLDKKLNRDLINNSNFPIYASTAPMWNTKFGFFNDATSTSITEITDLTSYQYHYGYLYNSLVATVDTSTSTITLPTGMHLTTPAPISTSNSDVDTFVLVKNYTAVRKADSGTPYDGDPHYLFFYYDLTTNEYHTYRCYNIYFQDSIPNSTFEGEYVFWFDTINNCWFRCKDGVIDLDFRNGFCTPIARVYYQTSTDANPGFIDHLDTDSFKIINANNSFEQPILTSNGTLGGNSFAVACSSNYTNETDAFAATNLTDGRWQMYNGQSFPQWITYYNPTSINVGQIAFNFYGVDSPNFFPTSYSLYGSNDNQTWTLIEKSTMYEKGISTDTISNAMNTGFEYSIKVKSHKESYKYHKLQINSTNQSGVCQISYMRLIESVSQSSFEDISFTQDRHEFMNSLDVYNNNNLIMLDQKQAFLTDRDTRIKQGINYAYGSNIKDALVTESQIANIFAWNTTDSRNIKNNIQTTHRQVPGIVMYYLGNGYDNSFTATIGCNVSDELNSIQYSHPVSYGSWYVDIADWKEEKSTSQLPWLPEEKGSCCRIFIPGCSYTRGKLESPQQIWQPDRNYYKGIKYQGKAIYHELVFKNRRSGCTDYNLDFDSGLTSIPDNDPQGLAIRLALAKNKEFYYNRPWFNELDKENKFDSSALADELVKPEEETTITYILDNTNCIFDDEYSNGGYIYDSSSGNITADPEKSYFNFLIQNRTTQPFTIQTGIVAFSLWSSTNISAGYGVCYNGTNYLNTNLTITDSQITVQFNSNTLLTVDKSTIDNIVLVMEFTPNSTKVTPYGLKNGSIVSTGTTYSDETSRTEQYLIDFRPYQVDKNLIYNFADLDIDFSTSIEGLTIKNGQMILQGSTETDQVIYNIAEKNEETKTKQLTDSEFYNNYRLDYDTYAKVFNQPR